MMMILPADEFAGMRVVLACMSIGDMRRLVAHADADEMGDDWHPILMQTGDGIGVTGVHGAGEVPKVNAYSYTSDDDYTPMFGTNDAK